MSLLKTKRKFEFKILGTSLDTEVVEWSLLERLSTPYQADLTLACEESIALSDALGKEARLTLHGNSEDRLVHGLIHRFAQTGKRGRFYLYHAQLVPQIWLLSQRQDNRIFQRQTLQQTIPEILNNVQITSDRFQFRLQENYPAKEYSVQYRENDLAFLSRLLEADGIWYFFEQAEDKHTLIFADSRSAYQPLSGESGIAFKQTKGVATQDDVIYQFALSQSIVPEKVSQTDFNYNTPSLGMSSQEQSGANTKLEIYEYPGGYDDPEAGARLAKVRLQEHLLMQVTGDGASTSPRLAPGYVFKLGGHPAPSFNQDYLIVSVQHRGTQPQVLEETLAPGTPSYSNSFTVIPAAAIYRPPRVTAKPIIQGPQTAVVMGTEGEDIYTDDLGRVKVHFHWDRLQDKDEKSSCWIRVSQFWAGEGWGAMFLPRRGHEVIVSFLDGDPDRPIITGRVYNGANPTPLALPDHKTKSTIHTKSTDGGQGSNELTFEDKQGEEEIYLHGQKNLRVTIDHDKEQTVGHDESLTVQHNRTKQVGDDESIQIGGTKNETIAKAATENVGLVKLTNVGADCSLNVGGAHTITIAGLMNTAVGLSQNEEVGLTKQLLTGHSFHTNVGKDHTLDVNGSSETRVGKQVIIEAGDSFEIHCGQSQFRLDKDGSVTITGKDFKFQASGPVQINGETVDIN